MWIVDPWILMIFFLRMVMVSKLQNSNHFTFDPLWQLQRPSRPKIGALLLSYQGAKLQVPTWIILNFLGVPYQSWVSQIRVYGEGTVRSWSYFSGTRLKFATRGLSKRSKPQFFSELARFILKLQGYSRCFVADIFCLGAGVCGGGVSIGVLVVYPWSWEEKGSKNSHGPKQGSIWDPFSRNCKG
jgi:hypothetical protein